MPPEKTAMSILGNLFVSEGNPGPVLEVRCRKRTGEDNFPSCIRKALEQAYPGEGQVSQMCQKSSRIGCVILCCKLQCGITQSILRLF